MKRMARVILPLSIASIAMVACQGVQDVTTPQPGTRMVPVEAAAAASFNGANQVGDALVKPLLRTQAVQGPVTASGKIGPSGGEIAIPSLGLRVIFFPGAVSSATTFTVSAQPGKLVAYEFLPHMTFGAPVLIQQDIRLTTAANNTAMQDKLLGGYFQGQPQDNLTGPQGAAFKVKETRLTEINNARTHMSFRVDHFSGYLASSGRCDANGNQDDR